MTQKLQFFEYMKSQNRPYSASDIFSNLHKKFGKTAIVKALESLSEENKLLEKVYGKSKIYVVHQSQFPEIDDAQMKKLEEHVSMLTKSLESSREKVSSTTLEFKTLVSSLTTKDALIELKKLREETSKLQEHLNSVSAKTTCVDPQQKKKANEERQTLIRHWRKRKRMATDLMNAVLEGYPKSKRQFLDEVGLETDEDCSVKIPE